MEALPLQKRESLSRWLNQAELAYLSDAIRSEVAALQAQAVNQLVNRPVVMPTEAEVALFRAARLQTFLDVLAEITGPEFMFRQARLSVVPN